ncbi:MbeD family mobilization/exclusion protein [Vibrio sp. 1-Bac 57]
MTELEKHLLDALTELSKNQETMFQDFKNTSESLVNRSLEQQKFCEALQQENKNLTQSVTNLTGHLTDLAIQLNVLLEKKKGS